ncbi:transposase [Saccharopolyspora phatthalungensis]|uniref:Transposase DDE domain-containing protein n=1 Tax=Saccharopolyspora phatthalungensis TaxID=664693 RepID=A0A840QI61_9PSEU|nr:transposase [Saccharopolyspora phatthalungensis]MBB5158255.1 hypothetical protein [Saccharopolyspora phatthalungensis]
MSKLTGSYPSLKVDIAGTRVVSNVGAVLLVQPLTTLGFDQVLSAALARWRRPTAIHDRGKIVCDLTLTPMIGEHSVAEIAALPQRTRGVRPRIPPRITSLWTETSLRGVYPSPAVAAGSGEKC